MKFKGSGVGGLYGWSPVLDQFLVGAASGLILIAGSSSMDPEEFGQFGFAYTVVAVISVIWRGGFLARLSLIESDRVLLSTLRRSVTVILLLAPVIMIVTMVVVWVASGREGLTLSTLLLCLSLPVVLSYEGLRQALIATDDSAWALASSTMWLLGTGATLAVTFRVNSALPVVLAWLALGVIGCIALWFRTSVVRARTESAEPSYGVNRGSLPSNRHFNLVAALPALASLGVATAALSEAGPLVMAQIVVLNAVLYPLSVYTQAVPLLARTLRRRGSSASGVATLGILGGGIAWFAAVTLLFPGAIDLLFGQSWILASDLLWIATLNLIAGALVVIEIARLHWGGLDKPVRTVVVVVSPIRVVTAWCVATLTDSAAWIIGAEFALHAAMWVFLRMKSTNAYHRDGRAPQQSTAPGDFS